MKWTFLLWLFVTLAVAAALEATSDKPTVLAQKPSLLTHALNDRNGGHDTINGNVKIQGVTIPDPDEQTPELIVRPEGVENGDGPPVIPDGVEIGDGDGPAVRPDGVEIGGGDRSPEILPEVAEEQLIVNTTHGPVKGVRVKSETTINYYDIPYGRFRNKFEAPTDPAPWTSALENIKHSVKCPQLDTSTYVGDTDCLTLSVFTRADNLNASVLFYIHESDFSTGSGDPDVYIPEGLVNRGVVLVLPNYRLGPLGFLCLKNSTAPGNAALKDLTLALEWTWNNIRSFGGDPMNIAVSGDGASAALAGYLALSPKSRTYISKVITDSGSALSHWAIDRNPIDRAETLAALIRNQTQGNTLNEDLFRAIEVEKLVTSASTTKLRPCIEQTEDGAFITETPWKILSTQKIDISFIIGTANHAGLLEALEHDEDSISDLNDHFTNILPNDLSFQSAAEMNDIGVNLRKQYFGEGSITLEQSEALSLFHTDASYLGPSLRVARALVYAGARVYLYEFSFVGTRNRNLASLNDPPGFGAVRGDIIGYLFPKELPSAVVLLIDETDQNTDQNEETAERRIVDTMADLWVSFLETGEPVAEDIVWRPLNHTTDASEEFLSIRNETTVAVGVHPDRLRLWTDIYEQHFVERNAGFGIAAGNYLAAVAVALVGFSKVWVG